MARPPIRRKYAAGIMERHDNHVLIVVPPQASADAGETAMRRWSFPGGPVGPDESPEAAMRRIAHEKLGVRVEVVVGQPPLVQRIGSEELEVRYFFCGVLVGEPRAGAYADLRWVPKGQLREYEFAEEAKAVVEWLLER